ncbi:hypothetical protein AL522_13785 [Pantoea vagans]|nr:hypothetical protein AL522_13785 [Pantoea vagans]
MFSFTIPADSDEFIKVLYATAFLPDVRLSLINFSAHIALAIKLSHSYNMLNFKVFLSMNLWQDSGLLKTLRFLLF